MAKRYYLGIDQGTTGTTVLLLTPDWSVAARGYAEYACTYPRPGWVEQDPMALWEALCAAVEQVLKACDVKNGEIICLGLDNQGETCMVWDRRTGTPVCPAIVWQDRRTAGEADALGAAHGEAIREKTGLLADSYFSATKYKWILEHVEGALEGARRGDLLLGTMDSWAIWKMTHGKLHITDASTASRTMLYNLHTGAWDEELLGLLGIPKAALPEIRDSAEVYGATDPLDFFGMKIPISGAVVDQQAALFGQVCFSPGAVKTTYGTGCFMLMNTGPAPVMPEHGLLGTVAWSLKGVRTFALDGGVYIAGAAVQWLRDKLGIISSAAETEEAAERAGDTGGVYFVPAFVGLAAPHWDPYARGTIVGLTGGTTKEQLIRATLESVAYQVWDNLDAMRKESGLPIPVMRADGGMANNAFLMQFQADILGIPVEVPEVVDTTALGAGYLAALGAGVCEGLEALSGAWKRARRYEPRMDPKTRETLLRGWHRAVERSAGWAEPQGEADN